LARRTCCRRDASSAARHEEPNNLARWRRLASGLLAFGASGLSPDRGLGMLTLLLTITVCGAVLTAIAALAVYGSRL
jgi:hypothetical protein